MRGPARPGDRARGRPARAARTSSRATRMPSTSTCAVGMPSASVSATRRARRRARDARDERAGCARRRRRGRSPRSPGQKRSIASTIVRAVSSASVACTSSAGSLSGRRCFEPGEMEELAPGALRRRLAEERLVQQALEQAQARRAPRSPRAVVVECCAEVPLRPRVEQHVAGPAVEAARMVRPAGRQDTLLMPPMLTTARERVALRKTASWNAGTSGAPCPPAAMSRRRKSATTSMPVQLGQPRRIVELDREAALGPVANGLAVAADRAIRARAQRRRAKRGIEPLRHRGRRARSMTSPGDIERIAPGSLRASRRSRSVGENGTDANASVRWRSREEFDDAPHRRRRGSCPT